MATVKKTTVRKTSPAVRKTVSPRAKTRKVSPAKVSSASSKNDRVKVFVYVGFGLLFGYFLTKAGLTDNDNILNMFLVFNKQYRDWHLYGVIGILVAILTLGVFLLQRFKAKPLVGEGPFVWKPKAFEPELLIGSAIFGAGWALTGACPATAIAQLGEGKVMAVATIAGILVGIWARRKFAEDK